MIISRCRINGNPAHAVHVDFCPSVGILCRELCADLVPHQRTINVVALGIPCRNAKRTIRQNCRRCIKGRVSRSAVQKLFQRLFGIGSPRLHLVGRGVFQNVMDVLRHLVDGVIRLRIGRIMEFFLYHRAQVFRDIQIILVHETAVDRLAFQIRLFCFCLRVHCPVVHIEQFSRIVVGVFREIILLCAEQPGRLHRCIPVNSGGTVRLVCRIGQVNIPSVCAVVFDGDTVFRELFPTSSAVFAVLLRR